MLSPTFFLVTRSTGCTHHTTTYKTRAILADSPYSDIVSELQSLEVLRYVLLDTSLDIAILSAYELLASNSLEQLYIALSDACNNLRCHVGHLLTLLTLEAILHKPLANELLRELLLLLALCEALLVTLLVEVAR